MILAIYGSFSFISCLMHEIIKDLISTEGDEKFKIKTLPTVWGIMKTKEFLKWLSTMSTFIIGAIAILIFNTNLYALSYYSFIAVIIPLFLLNIWIYQAQNTLDYIKISKLHKFIIFAGVMSLLFII